jgi:tRNA pseudouridine55 synthase
MNGLLVLDKPPGITSRDAVDRAATWFPRKTKIGHAGTLDPLATGVLVLAIGQATRLIEYVQAMPKVYRAKIRLGATSDTDDADGLITPVGQASSLPLSGQAGSLPQGVIQSALSQFLGEVEQVPPAYSAAHVDGRRAHSLARRGTEFTLAPRRVRIDCIELLAYNWPDLELEVHCGKGTYIRAIARDLGNALGVGGYVSELRRLSIGPFVAEGAVSLDVDAATALGQLLPMRMAVNDLRSISIMADEARRLRHGQTIPAMGDGEVAVLDASGELVAVGRVQNGTLKSAKVMSAFSAGLYN